jgi:phosphate transport system substrate-binding protein
MWRHRWLAWGGVVVGGVLAGFAPGAARPETAESAVPPYTAEPQLAGNVSVSAPRPLAGLVLAWIAALQKLQPGLAVEFALASGEENFAVVGPAGAVASAAPMRRVQVSMGTFDTVRHIQAIGVYVHPDNPLRGLTLEQLDAVYSVERRRGAAAGITTWGQLGLGGDWANRPIQVYGRRHDNVVSRYFREVVQHGGAFRAEYREPGEGASADVIAAVAADRFGIGFCGFAYQTTGIKRLALAGADGVLVEPTPAAVASGRYPLIRPLLLHLPLAEGAALDPAVRAFVRFALSREGQALVSADNYFPLPAAIAQAERAKLEAPAGAPPPSSASGNLKQN